ncbi:MAG: TlpA family protein disulfide reductase [Spirochaetaceae bacterium]|nr:MAG: TlpA family protein disulfide reductase [Spirochaetaceae bacterium]
MSNTELIFGSLVIPLRLAIPVASLFVSVLLLRWLPLGPGDSRRYAVDLVLGAVFAFLVAWKLTPILTLWDSVLQDPRVVLFAPGGALGAALGGIAALGYVLLRIRRDSVVWANLGPYLGLFGAMVMVIFLLGTSVSSLVAERNPQTQTFEPLSLRTLDGDTVTIGEASELPRLVNFWATWCVPCRSETQVKRNLARRYEGQIEVIGVNMTASERSLSDVRDFVSEWSVDYATALDPEGRAAAVFAIRGTPTSLLFAADGTLIDRFFGAMSDATAGSFIQPVLP